MGKYREYIFEVMIAETPIHSMASLSTVDIKR